MKKYIQIIKESLEECCDSTPAVAHQPVTMNVNLSASGEENVDSLMKMMKNAGLQSAKPVDQQMMPARQQMDKYLSMMDDEVQEDEGYGNTPGEVYHDSEMMTHNMSGGINKMKKAYASAEDGDNAMAVKKIKEQLLNVLAEKKAKPDYLDLDKDGDKSEPMKQAIKQAKSKKKIGEADSTNVLTYLVYMEKDALRSGKGKKYLLLDYHAPDGISYPKSFKEQIYQNQKIIDLRKQGYAGPEVVAGWSRGNMDADIEKLEKKVSQQQAGISTSDPISAKQDAQRLENLKMAKRMIQSGKV